MKKAVSSTSRVLYRSYNSTNTNGGVSYANANNDASNSNTNVGSRLENLHISSSLGKIGRSKSSHREES